MKPVVFRPAGVSATATPRAAWMLAWTLAWTLGLGLAVGCGGRASVDRTSSTGEDPFGNRTSTSGSSIHFHGSAAEAQLARAKSLASDGKFAEATEIFEALYTDLATAEAVRAEALLRWAEAEGSLLNPQRNLDRAIARLNLFEERFPASPLLPDARASRARLQALVAAPGGG
jgi:hypothetical protein